jgi:molecular chaperone GrpE
LSKGAEREEKEHVIRDDASWEEAIKHLENDDQSAGGERQQTAEERGDASSSEDGKEPALHGEQGDDGSGDTAGIEDATGADTTEKAGQVDGAEHKKEQSKAVQKRTKKSRKELVDVLAERECALEQTREELENIRQQLAIKEDKLIRMVAEFENYKKRTRREWELHQKRANAELIKDLLGILDDFERAFEAPDDSGEHFRSGVQLIYSGLLDVMGRAGLREIEAESRTFDPQYHEALGEMESDEVEEGNVLRVVQKGYTLRDQLLRPAKVIVAKARKTDK